MVDELALLNETPTCNRIHNNLWMGGWPSPYFKLESYFDCLALCASEYQIPDCFRNVEVIHTPLTDFGTPMTKEEAIAAVKVAIEVIKWLNEEKRVLVTCVSGRNRSGLVCALTLCKGPPYMKADEAIETIRNARGPFALSNKYFVNFIKLFCR
jgi:protein-tyrosine phosphatase